jgi:C-terminal peptidase prc
VRGFVLDLRGNPGGYMTAAVGVCELFLGAEHVVTVRPREGSAAGRPRLHHGKNQGDRTIELVVLIDGRTASSSEIVAACLQDHGRATIVGERSYGKGSVQDVLPIDETGGEIKLTMARYYPPSGRNIDKVAAEQDPAIKAWGVSPTVGFEVKLSPKELEKVLEHQRDLESIPPPGGKRPAVSTNNDRQLAAAVEHLRKTLVDRDKATKDSVTKCP